MDRNIGVGTTRARRGVALRKESVDRNNGRLRAVQNTKSLSARRAWIEIYIIKITETAPRRRSPQGERG